jgi:hypothetical protein
LMYSLCADFSDPIPQRRLTRDSLISAFVRKVTSRPGTSYLIQISIPKR